MWILTYFLSHGMCDGLRIDTKKGMAISKMMTLKMWQKQIDSWDGQFWPKKIICHI
jgi:hypothetical protein